MESRALLAVNYTSAFAAGPPTGQAGNAAIEASALDAAGDSVVVGSFTGSINFNSNPAGAPTTLTSNSGFRSVFVAKYDPSGTLLWAHMFGNSGGDDDAFGVAVDAAGNVYTTGQFTGSINFNPDAGGTPLTLTASQREDVFVLKLTSSGALGWAQQAVSTNFAEATGFSIAVDSAQNVFVTGAFGLNVGNTATFGSTTLTSGGATDSFVARLDVNGNWIWAKDFHGNASGGTSISNRSGIAVDAWDNVYTTGNFTGTVDFDPGTGVVSRTSQGASDGFVSKLDANGNFNWVNTFGSTGSDQGNKVAVDSAGLAVYVYGQYSGTVDFNAGYSGGPQTLTSTGAVGLFVAQFGLSAGNSIFARDLGVSRPSTDSGRGAIALDAAGNLDLVTEYTGTAVLGGVTLTNTSGIGAFFARMTSAGVFVAAGSLPDTGNTSNTSHTAVSGLGIAANATGGVVITGSYGSTANRGLNSLTLPAVAAGSSNLFVVGIGTSQGGIKAGDYDGDGKTDLAVYDPAGGAFIIGYSSGKAAQYIPWGLASDNLIPVGGDYDGDGKTDLAVYDQTQGAFIIGYSSGKPAQYIPWGVASHHDIPIAGDFDGDGKTDLAVYDPVGGAFIIGYSSGKPAQYIPWGVQSHYDIPVAGDFDGDGKTDLAVYDPVGGAFIIGYSSGKAAQYIPWGVQSHYDIPIAGDYDGDGKTDLAVYDPVGGAFIIGYSSGKAAQYIPWGVQSHNNIPVAGDFDGDKKTDLAVYDPVGGAFIIGYSSGKPAQYIPWGVAADNVIPIGGQLTGRSPARASVPGVSPAVATPSALLATVIAPDQTSAASSGVQAVAQVLPAQSKPKSAGSSLLGDNGLGLA